MDLIFSHLVTQNRDAFFAKVRSISNQLGVDPNWLMAVMWKESRINHRAVNTISNATGLIQFMPATARGLGTTTAALLNMSNVQQLDLVHAYFRPYRGRMRSYVEMYQACFFPISIGKPDEWVFQSSTLSAQLIARQNPGIDRNANGVITVATFTKYALRGFSADVLQVLTNQTNQIKTKLSMNKTLKTITIVCIALGVISGLLMLYVQLKKK